ncbi:MAG: hypothetical protein OXG35_30665 [Acidobacteria bacterium]|nr:hypothetical protein [Acidobacteriota bacterium]
MRPRDLRYRMNGLSLECLIKDCGAHIILLNGNEEPMDPDWETKPATAKAAVEHYRGYKELGFVPATLGMAVVTVAREADQDAGQLVKQTAAAEEIGLRETARGERQHTFRYDGAGLPQTWEQGRLIHRGDWALLPNPLMLVERIAGDPTGSTTLHELPAPQSRSQTRTQPRHGSEIR